MPGTVAVLVLDQPRENPRAADGNRYDRPSHEVQSGIVVEMSWAEEEGSFNYIFGPRFEVGAKVWWHQSLYEPQETIGGYLYVKLHSIVAWEPA